MPIIGGIKRKSPLDFNKNVRIGVAFPLDETNMFSGTQTIMDQAKANLLKSKPSIIKKEFESMVSMRSFVSKDEITSIIIYLLSDFSKNISGQSISVDGNTERMI